MHQCSLQKIIISDGFFFSKKNHTTTQSLYFVSISMRSSIVYNTGRNNIFFRMLGSIAQTNGDILKIQIKAVHKNGLFYLSSTRRTYTQYTYIEHFQQKHHIIGHWKMSFHF